MKWLIEAHWYIITHMERICGNCRWFRPEPGILVDIHSPANVIRRSRLPDAGRVEDGGSGPPPMYGKCKALYFGPDGRQCRYDTGNFSTTPCNAEDDAGGPLFQSSTALDNLM